MSFHVPVSLGLLDGAHVSSCKPHCPAPMGHASGQGEVTAGGDRPSSARKRVPPRPSAPRLRSNGLAGGDRPSSARKRVPPRPSAPGLRSNGLAGGTGPLLPGKECRPGHRPPGLRSNGLAGERGKSRLHVQTPRHTRTAPPGDYAAVLQALQLAWCSYPCVLARAPRGKGGAGPPLRALSPAAPAPHLPAAWVLLVGPARTSAPGGLSASPAALPTRVSWAAPVAHRCPGRRAWPAKTGHFSAADIR